MSRYSPHYCLDAILDAAESWKQNCLLANGAVLGSNILWNSPYLDELNTRYVLSPDEGKLRC
ncbi:MAG: hypothetical protein Q8Q73_07005 [Stagnimonas sp.]|nr:hypothetical protein [Stagnimonas sp.]